MVSAGVDGQLLLDLGDLPAVDGQGEVVGAAPALGVLGQLGEHGGAVLAGLLATAQQPDVEVAGQRHGAQPRVLVADPAREVLGLRGALAVGDGGLDGLVVLEDLDDVDHDAVVGGVDLGDVGGGVAVGQDRRGGPGALPGPGGLPGAGGGLVRPGLGLVGAGVLVIGGGRGRGGGRGLGGNPTGAQRPAVAARP